jgi:hypothetical protein
MPYNFGVNRPAGSNSNAMLKLIPMRSTWVRSRPISTWDILSPNSNPTHWNIPCRLGQDEETGLPPTGPKDGGEQGPAGEGTGQDEETGLPPTGPKDGGDQVPADEDTGQDEETGLPPTGQNDGGEQGPAPKGVVQDEAEEETMSILSEELAWLADVDEGYVDQDKAAER